MAWQPRGEFTHHWFCNLTEKLWSRYLLPIFSGRVEPINYLELGVAEAQSLLWALEHLGTAGGKFVGVDPFLPSRGWKPDEGNEHKRLAISNLCLWYELTKPASSGDDWVAFYSSGKKAEAMLYLQSSADFLAQEFGNSTKLCDIIYIDANHDAPHALLDLVLCFDLLREGGVMIVDDIERMYRGGRPQVGVAIDAFENCYHGYWDVLYHNPKQIAYVKVRRRRRGQYPHTLEQGPVIAPSGDVGEDGELNQ